MNDKSYVLDASAVLASIFQEPGCDALDPLMEWSSIGAVNFAEVVTKLQERGMDEERIGLILSGMNLSVVPFDEAQAMLAGELRATTRRKGLSLGDRACIALATGAGATVVTTDKAWAELDLPVPVMLLR